MRPPEKERPLKERPLEKERPRGAPFLPGVPLGRSFSHIRYLIFRKERLAERPTDKASRDALNVVLTQGASRRRSCRESPVPHLRFAYPTKPPTAQKVPIPHQKTTLPTLVPHLILTHNQRAFCITGTPKPHTLSHLMS